MVTLSEHDPQWARDFATEAARLQDALGTTLIAVHHIGSTAVPGLLAKPVIDILLEVDTLGALDEKTALIEQLNYIARGENGIIARRYFVKRGATGARSHQVHAFEAGRGQIASHLAFRDYLRAHPEVAAEYAGIKRASLAASDSRAAYQAAKDQWVADLSATLGSSDQT